MAAVSLTLELTDAQLNVLAERVATALAASEPTAGSYSLVDAATVARARS